MSTDKRTVQTAQLPRRNLNANKSMPHLGRDVSSDQDVSQQSKQLTSLERFNVAFASYPKIIKEMQTLVTRAQSRREKQTKSLNDKLTNLMHIKEEQKKDSQNSDLALSAIAAMADLFILHVSLHSNTESREIKKEIDAIKEQLANIFKVCGYDKHTFFSMEKLLRELLLETSPAKKKSISEQVAKIKKELGSLNVSLMQKKSQVQQRQEEEFKKTLDGLRASAAETLSAKGCKNIIDQIHQYCTAIDEYSRKRESRENGSSITNLTNQLSAFRIEAQQLGKKLDEEYKFLKQQEEAENHLAGCKQHFDSLVAEFNDPTTNPDELSKSLAGYMEARGREVDLAHKNNDRFFGAIEPTLSELKQKAEELKVLLKERSRYIYDFQAELRSLKNSVRQRIIEASSRETPKTLDERLEEFLKKIDKKISEVQRADRVLATELCKIKLDVQNMKKKLDEERTFARYLFQPLPGGNPELRQNIIYVSVEDGSYLCQGLNPHGQPYKQRVAVDSKLSLNEQLSNPSFQRDTLNELVATKLVSYTIEQDWEFFLKNLCVALNGVRELIAERDDKFHKELENVGIFYENGEYVLALEKANNFVKYRNYIFDTSSRIAAAFDREAAEERKAHLEKLHAEQFGFPAVYPVQSFIIRNEIFDDALENAQKFRWLQPRFREERSRLIAADSKRIEDTADGETRIKLENAQAEIKKRKEQEEKLLQQCKEQEKIIEKLAVSAESFEQEERKLKEYAEIKGKLEAVIQEKTAISNKIDGHITELGTQATLFNEINGELSQVDEEIRENEAIKRRINSLIDEFLSQYKRFEEASSFFMGIFRSIFKSNEVQLAKELAAIRRDIATKNNLTLSEIHSRVMTAIMYFKEMEGIDTIPPGLDQLKDELMEHHCQRKKENQDLDIIGNNLLQERAGLSYKQERMIIDMQEIKKEISKCDCELQKSSQKEAEIMQRKQDLEAQVKAIETRRQQEKEAIAVLDKLNPERAAIVLARSGLEDDPIDIPSSPVLPLKSKLYEKKESQSNSQMGFFAPSATQNVKESEGQASEEGSPSFFSSFKKCARSAIDLSTVSDILSVNPPTLSN